MLPARYDSFGLPRNCRRGLSQSSQMIYTERERRRCSAWKSRTQTLPEPARVPAPYVGKTGHRGATSYDFCLPAEHAELNLLPEVRQPVLALFADAGIPWHAGVDGGPSNHLLSSQVQCANALGQMIDDPSRLVRAFGELLGIEDVLEIEPGRFLTFEYIGPTDFFGEVPTAERIRGAHCTSVDAAFLHRRRDGLRELVLVEWKYTESYALRRPDPDKDAVRRARYGVAWSAPDSPVRADLLPFDLVLDEPFYQLVPPDNEAYQASLVRPEHRALGASVSEVWQRLLVGRDRFVSVDPAVFLDPEVTSAEYVSRYGQQG
jgi:hypothetical protein